MNENFIRLNNRLIIAFAYCFLLLSGCTKYFAPISLHPENPHYFLFRGKPTVLIGSTEHYGAVMNLGFDYVKYLDALALSGLNVTRTFTGIYLEPQGAFGISNNTLAPGKERLICPWARSNQPGYPGGGNKFNLSEWDEAYFTRLKDFISEAGKRNIIVELDLFSNFYDTMQWKLSPLYCTNNINNIGNILDQKEILSLRHPEILKIGDDMVRKIITELNSFDNLYYEICNEPYFGDLMALKAWEKHMTGVVVEAEKGLPNKHLISNNIGNGSLKIQDPVADVSIFNFHYCKPPLAVEMNFALNKAIGDNETGFDGIDNISYRTEAWDFLVAGGALFNNLDYSFTTDNEDGSYIVAPGQPGGGGTSLRGQLFTLATIFREIDFVNMKPSNSIIEENFDGPATLRVLAKEGSQYLLYLNNIKSSRADGFLTEYSKKFAISLPQGDYKAEWINPLTGFRDSFLIAGHHGGTLILKTPSFREDIALKIIGNK
jgi:hypothetical protein